jgi:hypothetical protein
MLQPVSAQPLLGTHWCRDPRATTHADALPGSPTAMVYGSSAFAPSSAAALCWGVSTSKVAPVLHGKRE